MTPPPTCPICGARYQRTKGLGPGWLRCGRCGQSWRSSGEVEAALRLVSAEEAEQLQRMFDGEEAA